MLLKIYIGFCLITFLIIEISTYEAIQVAKIKYADKLKDNKPNILGTLFQHIRMFIMSFIPIINLCIFFSLLFNHMKVVENALNKFDKELKENDNI